jgi:hypothetical protein
MYTLFRRLSTGINLSRLDGCFALGCGVAMSSLRRLGRASIVPALMATLAVTTFGQVTPPTDSFGGPLTGPPVFEAPFSADATTTVHAILGDGTRLDQSTTDHYYRDSAGRVRVERPMAGLPAPKTMSERHIRTLVDTDPGDRLRFVASLDAQTRTVRRSLPRGLRAWTLVGDHFFAVPVGGVRFLTFRRAGDLLLADPGAFGDVRDEWLGTRRIAGVATTGRRITIVVSPGYGRNDQWREMVDERWGSAELQLLVYSRHSDSSGTIEYRLSNIRRTEPPAHLFEVPPDYTMEDVFPSNRDASASFAAAEGPNAGAFREGRRPGSSTRRKQVSSDGIVRPK